MSIRVGVARMEVHIAIRCVIPAVTKKRPYRVLESWKEKEKGRRFSVIDGAVAVAVAVSGAVVRDGRGIDVVV